MMPLASLDLTTLSSWVRRTSGDTAQAATQTASSDGTGVITLNATGTITITSILAGVVTLNPSTYSLSGSTVIIVPAPTQGTSIVVSYTTTRYADDDIFGFLTDSARGLAGSLKFGWTVDTVGLTVTDGVNPQSGQDYYQLANCSGTIRPEIEQLIVYGAGLGIYADKANTAADNAIKIKDGDTSIDTSATAGASEKAIVRLVSMYKDALKKVLSEGFVGAVTNMECIFEQWPLYGWIQPYWGWNI